MLQSIYASYASFNIINHVTVFSEKIYLHVLHVHDVGQGSSPPLKVHLDSQIC